MLSGLPEDAILAPATSAQRGLWLTHLLDPTSTAYHVCHAYRIRGELDIAALRLALARLTARHDALRTSFAQIDGQLYQAVHPECQCDLRVDRRPVAAGDLLPTVRAEFDRLFDPHRAPLLRVRLFVEHERCHVLTLVGHHLVLDADSMNLLWSELAEYYEAAVAGVAGHAQDGPNLQFTDYANWEADWMGTPDCAEHIRFFRERLADIPVALDLPLAYLPAPAWQGGVESVLLSADTTGALLGTARACQATPFMVCLTLFAGVLYRWADQPEVVVGAPASLRDEPGLEDTVGMLVNSVAVVTRWHDDPSFRTVLDRNRAELVECLAWQKCPFDHLVMNLRPARDRSRSPIFQVYCGYSRGEPTVPRLVGLSTERIDIPIRTSKFELSLDACLVGDRLRCDLEWTAERFDEATAVLFAEHLRIAAQHAAAYPDDRVGEWPLTVDPQREVRSCG